MDRGAWHALVDGVGKSQTRLSNLILTHSQSLPSQLGLLSTVEPYELVSQKYYQCAEPCEEKTRVLVSEYQGILENLGESLNVKYLK